MSDAFTFIYVVTLVFREKFGKMSSEEEAIVEKHYARLKKALDDGKLILAGPCSDGAFGIVVFRARSERDAKKFMEDDPAVKGGLMKAELYPFRVSLMAEDNLEIRAT